MVPPSAKARLPKIMSTKVPLWYTRANDAQQALTRNFWNAELNIMNQQAPCSTGCNDRFIYWWHAHVLDVLLDAYLRTRDEAFMALLLQTLKGVRDCNGATLLHNWYDDMQWMALALLRAHEVSGEETLRQEVNALWTDIKTGWNGHCGGGIAWKKDQLDYKNTPANAPAVILSARLYRMFGLEADLHWALRIYSWLKGHLVDPVTGFVWDGMNRLGDGAVDMAWNFTYNQGIMVGAGLELYAATGSKTYLNDAMQTTHAAIARLVDSSTGMLPHEGSGDGGLFKGIFVRYFSQLLLHQPQRNLVDVLKHNAGQLWQRGRDPSTGLFSLSWTTPPDPPVDLSGHLSGVMLIESLALLEAHGLFTSTGMETSSC